MRARAALCVALVTAAAVVAGCSGGGGPSAASSESTSGSATDAPVSPTQASSSTVSGVVTTPPGTKLRLGQRAVLFYAPNAKHESVIKLTVDRLKRGKLKDLKNFRLSDQAKKSSVYYVSVAVKNAGDGDLGGQPVQLYGKVSNDLVIPPVTLNSTFKKCDDQPLPSPFKRGDRTNLCVLLLAPHHGDVTAVQWRPADDSKPITWATRH
jgi:hypothetical protein